MMKNFVRNSVWATGLVPITDDVFKHFDIVCQFFWYLVWYLIFYLCGFPWLCAYVVWKNQYGSYFAQLRHSGNVPTMQQWFVYNFTMSNAWDIRSLHLCLLCHWDDYQSISNGSHWEGNLPGRHMESTWPLHCSCRVSGEHNFIFDIITVKSH